MKIKFTYVLIALLIAVFAIELAFPQIIDELAFSPSSVAAKPWTAVTAIFAHADFEHILANLVVLWFFGLAVERELGRKKTALIFLVGAFVGEIASLVLYAPDVLSLGASGGIFALIGAAIFVQPFMEMTAWQGAATMPMMFLAVIYIVYNTIGLFAGPSDIAYGTHFAGLAIGLAIGAIYRRRLAVRRKKL
jgi:membrane associated rhomboid family serine protease